MKNKLVFISLSILLVISVTFTFLFSKIREVKNDRDYLLTNLTQTIPQEKLNNNFVIDISTLTPFAWDRFFVFAPYASPERINSTLGRLWVGQYFTTIKTNDRVTLLVFTNKGRVVQYLEYPRGNGDFSTVDNNIGYSAEESLFSIDEKGRIVWVYLK
jgi:hypothetical protein